MLSSCSAEFSAPAEMKLSNPNANESAKKVYNYICSIFQNSVISGQQESTWMDSPDYEINYLNRSTGKLPAIRGFDFMNDDFDGVVQRAKDWWEKGGIVTICWHCGADFNNGYDECMQDEIKDWNDVLTPGASKYTEFINNMDKAGKALLSLQEAGVPVLWRPFHEFDGGWFWWGKGGAENFCSLWKLMYHHFTYDLKLNNLIWVLGYSHNGSGLDKWYPGDEYCDIVGADSYEVEKNGAEKGLFNKSKRVSSAKKPLFLHECGKIPSEKQFKDVPWGAFMTWHTEQLTEQNTHEELNLIYNSDYVITLDELPDFKA
ncbi:MAG: glycoside hydrolase family 26 protein [Clostridiales bacterium]|nr:glycoside hydrolase family 26 protein [Clostridiales bacterium]